MEYGDTAPYMSYADCVAQEHADTFMPILGCRPPWLSAPDAPEMCQGQIPVTPNQHNDWLSNITILQMKYLVSGKAHSENCTKPCKGLFAYSKVVRIEKDNTNASITYLKFNKEVKITKYVRTYGLFELVVDVGSSLGLWIGLSAVGLFDLVLDAGICIKKRLGDGKKRPLGNNIRNK